jgi:hypothetical protein
MADIQAFAGTCQLLPLSQLPSSKDLRYRYPVSLGTDFDSIPSAVRPQTTERGSWTFARSCTRANVGPSSASVVVDDHVLVCCVAGR